MDQPSFSDIGPAQGRAPSQVDRPWETSVGLLAEPLYYCAAKRLLRCP